MTHFSITILLIPFTQAVKQPLQFLVGRYDNNLADYVQTRWPDRTANGIIPLRQNNDINSFRTWENVAKKY